MVDTWKTVFFFLFMVYLRWEGTIKTLGDSQRHDIDAAGVKNSFAKNDA